MIAESAPESQVDEQSLYKRKPTVTTRTIFPTCPALPVGTKNYMTAAGFEALRRSM